MELDLTEAVDAAARSVYEELVEESKRKLPVANHYSWEELPDLHKHHYRQGVLSVVSAASAALAVQAVDQVRVRLLEAAEGLADHPDIKQHYLIAYDLVAEVTE